MVLLLVDDEPAPLKELTMAVREAAPEAEVHAFQWSRDALAFAADHAVDVAFLDANMPEIDGVELAKRLKACQKYINVIFCTGHDRYMPEAFMLHASGYLMKPVEADAIREEMQNLRFDQSDIEKNEESPSCRFRVKTFGSFTFFADGKPVSFTRSKAKEALAYLVDRKGSAINRKEMAAVLFEDTPYDRNLQNYLTKIIRSLQESLEAVDASGLLIVSFNQYAVDTSKFTCDMYDLCNGNKEVRKEYMGEYMTQYSWAEMTQMTLEDIMNKGE